MSIHRIFSFCISVIFHIPLTLVISELDLKLFSLRLIFDVNLHVLWSWHVASSSTITLCAIESRYAKRLHILNTLRFLYCVTSNNHTSWNILNLPKTVVLVIIYILIFWAVGMSEFTPFPYEIKVSMMSLFPQFFFYDNLFTEVYFVKYHFLYAHLITL